MRTIELQGGSLVIYNDIQQLPADRYKEFQKYQLMDTGIGSGMESVDERFANMFKHIGRNKTEDARKELENLYYLHYFIIKGINVEHLSFGCMIYSLADKLVTDYSEDNLRSVIKLASDLGLTQRVLEDNLLDTKKNFNSN